MGLDSKQVLLGGVAAGGLALGAYCFANRVQEVECDELDAVIPTKEGLKELKRTGKSKEELAREDAYATLPVNRPEARCSPLPGSVVREHKEFAPRPNYLKQRTKRDAFPAQASVPLNPVSLWRDPKRHEYMNNHLDATRWQWTHFTHVDDAQQLLSSQYVYRSAEYGVKVVLIPTLRLADKQFYDSVMETILATKGVVMCEKLHHESQNAQLKAKEEQHKSIPRPYDEMPLSASQPHAVRRGMEGGAELMKAVGGDCICLEYLFALIETHCYWMMGDKGLGDQEMRNIQVTVNAIQSFVPMCAVRESYLLNRLDDCLKAAASDAAWKQVTGQEREGEKVLVLPWNGRHCDRIEKFLIQARGFEPVLNETRHRIIFDHDQVVVMVARANKESENDEREALQLPHTPYPDNMPSFTPPAHNFGPYAGEVPKYALRALAQSAEGASLRHLELMAEIAAP